ncbi:MAG: tRNA isopentenyl-2-thiomethyl-A-37 hydroxylase MiaE [Myxococcales bacterium]|nr:tRNA-(ms[2]io[6]A)-hydroxylase [Polyangiaceae bacterium]MDW8248926.1 tRNA isopentenyl-2-thiomethyl-A-37 hydroxylase MiaE [Myxococcales bacterium]
MLCLVKATDPVWVEVALNNLDALLIDHAHCEIKAATNALSLASRAIDGRMAEQLAALAEEEVRHFRQVLDELGRRGLRLGMPLPDTYAAELRTIAHRTRPTGRSPRETLLDRLLIGALIEARSCERFRLLADALAVRGERTLATFYEDLFASEARHYRTLYDLAVEAIGNEERTRERLAELAWEEARLNARLGVEAAVHG